MKKPKPYDFSDLTEINLVAAYSVSLDLLDASQVSMPATIPLYNQVVRFAILCPANNPGMVDRYCGLRWNSLVILENRGVIDGVTQIKGHHRWRTQLNVTFDTPKFQKALQALEAQMKVRKLLEAPGTEVEPQQDALNIVRLVLQRFHAVAVQLRHRYDDRPTLDVSNEYDAQDLLHALLRIYFDDIRPEEWTPSYAGASSRVDFLLKNEKIVIEVKMTRTGLNAKKLGEQLIIDKARYKTASSCDRLICFVYDPDHRIPNPAGLENDLSESGKMSTEVVILPKPSS